MGKLTSEDAKTLVILAAGLGGVATVAYFVYALANPGPKGGSCTTPGTPCYNALLPYQQEFQSCLNQYTQLWSQIAQSGQAPTDAQLQVSAQLRDCMDVAAGNVANTAQEYVPDNWATLLEQVITAAALIAFAAYGLPGIADFVNRLRSQGEITTKASNGAGIAAIVFDATVQYAALNNLISSTQVTAWETAVGSFAGNDILAVSVFYNSLVNIGLLTVYPAALQINAMTATIAADANAVLAALARLPLPMMAHQEGCDC
jgi:hypothetical protein